MLAIVFIGLFGAAYWQNWNPWVLGGTIGAGLFLLGFGLTAWGKYLMPQGPFVEERHPLAATQEERDSMSAALVERSAVVVKRRKMLGGLFAARRRASSASWPSSRCCARSARCPRTRSTSPTGARGTVLVDSNGRPGAARHPRGRRDHDRLPARHDCRTPDRQVTSPTRARPSTRPC